jgi:hypothetical protein
MKISFKLIIVILVVLPIFLFIILCFVDPWYKKYKISNKSCQICRSKIGINAVNIAHNEWKDKIKRAKESKIKLPKNEYKYWYLNCQKCSAHYKLTYNTGGRFFKLIK